MNEQRLEGLIRASRQVEMTAEQREEQRRSFVHGNLNIENGQVTREVVDRAAERIPPGGR